MSFSNRITELFGIRYPIIQAGMVWCSGWRLAAAVANAGGLGIIGAGSMYPDVLREHIRRCREALQSGAVFAVNVPMLYPDIDKHMAIIMEERVPVVFTSAGNPAVWTAPLQEAGCRVAHVVSSVKFAQKAEQAGVDAVVAEGFEAGGHNGREETTTLCLVPMVRRAIKIPLIAAGGIATGAAMLAAFALGAEGVQIGTRFAASEESSAHPAFKARVIGLQEGETELVLKQLAPVRMIKNEFYQQVKTAELRGATVEELRALLGRGRAKKGIFEGDLQEGELEIGQVAALVDAIKPAAQIVNEIWQEFRQEARKLSHLLA
ncbi:NAD(P)H-dependent flavin oxidoreductase [Rhodoflexus sp.]